MSSDMHSEAGTEANILDRLRKPVSNVSTSLGPRYDKVDSIQQTPTHQAKACRQKAPAWSLLEAVLYDWQRLVEERGAITTTEILQKKAKEIWEQLPE
ncbi:hypothetical protein GMDG_08694 [Pseudogymnoascus destructans 20631-21]|uniref:HTH CENPB-type domain-containing protein n=1 Tax=Pseudogymnoascus destructans (strain ATCC MYA-4855 / 20631-21) TaxID=658429 RepID=L8G9B1_PSED2|nr:hypothetical protein GMDG_08694 [Pseudogymnoascus destructans 20631-21]